METLLGTLLLALTIITFIAWLIQKAKLRREQEIRGIAQEEVKKALTKLEDTKQMYRQETIFNAAKARAEEAMLKKNGKEVDQNIKEMLDAQKKAENFKKKIGE